MDPTSSKYQNCSKLSAQYYCIADLLQADMIESGDGTILIMNGHTILAITIMLKFCLTMLSDMFFVYTGVWHYSRFTG